MGTTLRGKWHLDALLGVGGMAAVYAATHRNGMRGAVKMLHRAQSQDEETRTRFLREGYIANRVEHHGAVRVLDDDVTEDGVAFLVMELLEGEALHERAGTLGGKLPVDMMLLIADQLLEVLAAAHAQGIVHRDIKPENVFITKDGLVKILDFGIARINEPAKPSATATMAGSPMGTPAFMAPEQARGRWDLVGPQSDLWSLGASMFTLLSGHFVHEEETVQELIAAVFTKPARSLAVASPGTPQRVIEIVDRALALKLADRFEDASTMREAVRGAYRAITGEEMPAAPPARPVMKSDPGMRMKLASRPSHPEVVRPVSRTLSTAAAELARALPMRTKRMVVAAAGAAALGVGVLVSTLGSPSAAAARLSPIALATQAVATTAETAPIPIREAEVERNAPAALPIAAPTSTTTAPSATANTVLANVVANTTPTATNNAGPSAQIATSLGNGPSSTSKAKAAPAKPTPSAPSTKQLFDRRH